MGPLHEKCRTVRSARWAHLVWYGLGAVLLVPIRLIYLQISLQNTNLVEYLFPPCLLPNVCFNVTHRIFIECLYQPAIIFVLSHFMLFSNCCPCLILAFFLPVAILTSNITIYCSIPLFLLHIALSLNVLSLDAMETWTTKHLCFTVAYLDLIWKSSTFNFTNSFALFLFSWDFYFFLLVVHFQVKNYVFINPSYKNNFKILTLF